MTYWLVINFCIAIANNQQMCAPRLVPEPLGSHIECQTVAMALLKEKAEFKLPAVCTNKKPHLPLIPSTAGSTNA